MFSKIKLRFYKLFTTFFFRLFLIRILANEVFVFQEESIVLACFFFLVGYVILIKKAPSQIYASLETQVLSFLTNFAARCVFIFNRNKKSLSSIFVNKFFKISVNSELFVAFIGNLFKNNYTLFFFSFIDQILNKGVELLFIKKEYGINIINSVINRVYLHT